jgi:hypothetical protein
VELAAHGGRNPMPGELLERGMLSKIVTWRNIED